jgi:hypothetical protein
MVAYRSLVRVALAVRTRFGLIDTAAASHFMGLHLSYSLVLGGWTCGFWLDDMLWRHGPFDRMSTECVLQRVQAFCSDVVFV